MNEQKELLDLIEIIEEQQELLAILLTMYPESPEKTKIQASAKRIRQKTKRVKRNLTPGV